MVKKQKNLQPSVLFLISLPMTEFENLREPIVECIRELREQHVEVREHIWPDDLADAGTYDIVIVVAHRDLNSDNLVLADGEMPMSTFVDAFTDFKGFIDFSTCYSDTVAAAIKKHNPACRVQTALYMVPLLRRILIYPSVVRHLNDHPEIDYGKAYRDVAQSFDLLIEENKSQLMASSTNYLGTMSSLGYPSIVKCNSPFLVQFFIHSDADGVVLQITSDIRNSQRHSRILKRLDVHLDDVDNIISRLAFNTDPFPDYVSFLLGGGEKPVVWDSDKKMGRAVFNCGVKEGFPLDAFNGTLSTIVNGDPIDRCEFVIEMSVSGQDAEKADKNTQEHQLNIETSQNWKTRMPDDSPALRLLKGQPWISAKAREYFLKAIDEKWIVLEDNRLKWEGFGIKPEGKKSFISRTRKLAWFCFKVLERDYDGRLPWREIEEFFGEEKLSRDYGNLDPKNPQPWMKTIDNFIFG